MSEISAVVFDLGHTVWDYAPTPGSYRLRAIRLHDRLAPEVGAAALPDPDQLGRAIAEVTRRWYLHWEQNGGHEQPPSSWFVREGLAGCGIDPGAALLEELTDIMFGAELDMPVIEPDTLATLDALHSRGLALGCVTNTITTEPGIRDALARLGLLRYFRSVVVSSAAGYHKPHPSLFQRAVEELGVAPQAAVFVGDRLRDDVSGARSVGMRAVLTHQYRREEVDGAGPRGDRAAPDAIIRRLSELPAVLERLSTG
jgi:putative hydrolase of the HAD superfamily